MELIVDELSIKKIEKKDDFKEYVYFNDLVTKLGSCLLKKDDILDSETSIYSDIKNRNLLVREVIAGDVSATIRRVRAILLKRPYWGIYDRKHSDVHFYECPYTDKTEMYGIAEATERNRLLFTFENDSCVCVEKKNINGELEEKIEVSLFSSKNNLLKHLLKKGIIDENFFLKNYKFKNYKFLDFGCIGHVKEQAIKSIIIFDFLENDLKNSPLDFNRFSSPDKGKYSSSRILTDVGKNNTIHKYRVNGVIRCWGFMEEKQFVPVYVETNKEITG